MDRFGGPLFLYCIFNEPLSLRVKQGVVTAVGVFVDFAVSYAFKSFGTGQSFAETTDAGEHIYELDQGHNSRWGCLPDLRMCLIGTPHQKQRQPVTGCTEQDFFTVHYVSTSLLSFCIFISTYYRNTGITPYSEFRKSSAESGIAFFGSGLGTALVMLTACNSSRTTLRMLFSSLSVCSAARILCTRSSLRLAGGTCCNNAHVFVLHY